MSSGAVLPSPATSQVAAGDGRAHASKRRERRDAGPEAGGRSFPAWGWMVAGLLALSGLVAPNGVLTSCCILLVPVLCQMLWFKGEPPVLLFACMMQWLQATVAVFYLDFYGGTLQDAFGAPQLTEASWLSLIGVAVLAVGMRCGMFRRKAVSPEQLEQEAGQLNPGKVFMYYLAAFAYSGLAAHAAWLVPAVTQLILATTTLRWVLVYLLGQAVLTQRRGYGLLTMMVLLEVVTGLLGYFSGFKSVFFVLFVVLMGTRRRLRGWNLAVGIATVVALICMGVVWSVIKEEYREFLNQGTGQQVVLVPVAERVDKLGELTRGLDGPALKEGLDRLVLRVSAVNYFAYTLINVPANVPFENGALWMGAVKHVFMPRIFFPDKAQISDSARTREYAGVMVAGTEEGTSIGIGYMGESYIDFGKKGMFAPIFLLGAFYGLMYRWLGQANRHQTLGLAMVTGILVFTASGIEESNIKLFGGNVMGLLVMGLFARFSGQWFWELVTAAPTALKHRRNRRSPSSRQEPG